MCFCQLNQAVCVTAVEHCLVTLFAAVPQTLVSFLHTRQALADTASKCCEVLGLSRHTAESESHCFTVGVCRAQQRCLFAGYGDSHVQAVQGGNASRKGLLALPPLGGRGPGKISIRYLQSCD